MRALVLAATISGVVLGGCATGDEWKTWKSHRSHFASGEHLIFSVQNTVGDSPRVARRDIVRAGDEGWWGEPIAVAQEQIVER